MRLAPSGDSERRREPFADVRARRAVDELFRNTQQALVSYTGQADLKANLVITTSSLMLTLVAAITVVIPKFRLPRRGETREHFEPHENPLFFGHFASMRRERFVEVIAEIASEDATLYAAQAADIYDQGRYLVEKKYRHLRLAYTFLGLAFVFGLTAQLLTLVV